jgi:hypothetical protein
MHTHAIAKKKKNPKKNMHVAHLAKSKPFSALRALLLATASAKRTRAAAHVMMRHVVRTRFAASAPPHWPGRATIHSFQVHNV